MSSVNSNRNNIIIETSLSLGKKDDKLEPKNNSLSSSNIINTDSLKILSQEKGLSDPVIKNLEFVLNQNDPGLNQKEKNIAEKLTSLFENDTTILQYAYAEHLDDGRGITAGRAGFTTGTNDLYLVVKKYTQLKPDNNLAKYLPRLKELSELPDSDEKGRASIKGLDGLIKNWKQTSKDPNFKVIQDQVVDQAYYQPAMKHCDDLGLKLNLSKAFIYDTIIQHGDGKDLDGLNALVNKTNKIMNGSPKTGIDEQKWLTTFIKVRRQDLAHSHDKETREVWSQSVGRCDAFSAIAKTGNYALNEPVKLHTNQYDNIIFANK